MKNFFKKHWFNILIILWLSVLTYFTYYSVVAVDTVILFIDTEIIPTIFEIIKSITRKYPI